MVLPRVGLILPPSGFQSVGVLGVALLGLCLAKGWCSVTVGDFESFLSCSCFCSRRPPEAGGEGSNDVPGADPEIC